MGKLMRHEKKTESDAAIGSDTCGLVLVKSVCRT
jgi:hypothetical protein